jgi:gliding motility-associated-like protein
MKIQRLNIALPVALLMLFSGGAMAQFSVGFTINGRTATNGGTFNVCTNTTMVLQSTSSSASFFSLGWSYFAGMTPAGPSTSTSHTYTSPGTYRVTHYANSTFDNKRDSLWINVVVSADNPRASFTFSPSSLECGSTNYQFNSGTSVLASSYVWNFNDGVGSSTAANPTYSFVRAVGNSGNTTYGVNLRITSPAGCTDDTTINVTVRNIPDINLNTSDNNIQVSTFNSIPTFRRCSNVPEYMFPLVNLSSTTATNTEYTIKWGDGSPDSTFTSWPTANVINHIFKLGSTTMNITIKNGAGCVVSRNYVMFVGSNPAAGFASLGNTEICAPDSLRFVISGVAQNAPGTTYSVTVNDNTPPVNFIHPLPADTVGHRFLRSSCGISSSNGAQTFQNSFRAVLDAENPCGSTSVSVIPIYVSGKPNPAIGVSPQRNICVNTNVTISNVGNFGGRVISTGGGASTCENLGKVVWSISPATGFVLIGGSYGSTNGNVSNGVFWTAGTNAINLTFTQPGTYRVKQYMSNERCGMDSIEDQICVRLPPSSTFSVDRFSICAGQTITANNTSPVGECGGETYSWNVSFSDVENCGAGSNFAYVGGTTAASKNPQWRFDGPGQYIVELTVRGVASGCSSPIDRDTILVKAPPRVTLPAIPSVCVGNSITPTATVVNCYSTQAPTYLWTFTGGSPATSTDANPGAVTYATNGTFTVQLAVTNECGTTTQTRSVIIANPPVANAGPNRNFCSGQTALIGSTSSPGISYGWQPGFGLSNPNSSTTTIAATYTGPSADTTITYVVTASAGASCLSRDTVLVTIRRAPMVDVQPAVTSICAGATAQLTASGADSYTWSPAAGLSATTGATVDARPANSTTYTVVGTLGNGCSAQTTVRVNVVNFVPANAGPNVAYCSGQPAQLAGVNAGMNYSWQPTTGISNSNISNPQLALTYAGPSADTTIPYILTASAGANCSSTDTVLVTVRRSPIVSVTPANVQICPGQRTTLTAAGADGYAWAPSAGLSATTGAAVEAAPSDTQTYTVTGTLANGCFATATSTVAVVTVPVVNAGPDRLFCNNAGAQQLNGTPANGVWSGTGVNASGLFTPATAGNGVFKLYYTFGVSGCSGVDSTIVTVQNPPAVSAGRDTALCTSASTLQLTGTPSGGSWRGASVVNSTGLVQLNQPGSYQLIYEIGSGFCINTDTVLLVVGNAVSNNTITPVANVCLGATPARINGAVATAGGAAIGYQWQRSADSTNWQNIPGETGVNFQPPAPTTTVFYRRVASSTLCSGGVASNVVAIRINPDAVALFTPTTTRGCAPFALTPALINLSPFPASNSQYLWFANGNALGSGTNFPGFTITNPDDSVTIRLITISRFGCQSDTMEHRFYTAPVATPAFALSDTVGCGPLTITIANNTLSKGRFTYQWRFGNGQTSTLADPPPLTFTSNPNFGDTIYTVTLRATAGCDTTVLTQQVRVRAPAKALISPDKVQGCSPAIFNFTNISRGSGATYTWNFGDGSTQITGNQATVQHTYNTGVRRFYTVRLVSTNACGSDTARVNVLVTPNPIRLDVLVNANQTNGCTPHTVQFINTTSGATTFAYNFGDGSPVLNTTTSLDTVVHTYTQPGTYIMRVTAGNGCTDTTTTRSIEVRNSPRAAFAINPTVVCVGQSVALTNQSSAGASLVWRFGDGSSSSATNPTKAYAAKGTYRVGLYASNSFGQGFTCTDSAFATVIVRDTIPGDFSVDSLGSCAPFVVTLKSAQRPAAQTIWNFGDGNSASGDSVVHAYQLAGNYVVNMTSRVAGGCYYSASKTIAVFGPSGQLNYTAPFACFGQAVPSEVVSTNTQRYIYYFGNGDSLVTTNGRVSYVYPTPGRFLPKVLLQSGNCSRLLAGRDSISIDRVVAGFQQRFTTNCGNTVFQFTDNGTAFYGKGSWLWNFGDGTSSTLQNPSKVYTTPGVYNIRLRLTGLSGCVDSVTVPIRVDVQPIPASTIVGDSLACIGQVARFSALVQNADSIAAYAWTFGNGTSAQGANASTIYNQGGLYTVQLISRTPFGCADTVRKTIRVSVAPLVTAGPDLRICRGQSTLLQARGANTYQWSPTQGLSCANCDSPTAQPLVTTTYVVTGRNNFGCASTDTLTVEVVQPFDISWSASDSLCLGQSKQLSANGAFRYEWTPATGLNSANIANPLARPAISTTYRVVGYDNFNCFTDTGFVTIGVGQIPTVELGTGRLVVAGTVVPQQPVFTNGPFVNYNWTPTSGLSCLNCPNPNITVNTNTVYSLTVTSAYGCTATDTIGYRVVCQQDQIYIPNAFSPDGDGVNDVLMVRGKGVSKVRYFRVFNRWGQIVFERSNFDANDPRYGWDGKINGIPANPDVYVYTADVLCTAGGAFVYKGNVTLVK